MAAGCWYRCSRAVRVAGLDAKVARQQSTNPFTEFIISACQKKEQHQLMASLLESLSKNKRDKNVLISVLLWR
jgi:hypothetical protein